MRVLRNVRPTPEQLKIISRSKAGVLVIRGAAGSGKTTTALLRLRSIVGTYIRRKNRSDDDDPVRVIVLTYNRTLKGYIETLAEDQIGDTDEIEFSVSTFSKWAKDLIELENGPIQIIKDSLKKRKIRELSTIKELPFDFIYEEISYAIGRFLPGDIDSYIECIRHGRGKSPRVEKQLREEIVNTIIKPYQKYIDSEGLWDWNDLAYELSETKYSDYDVIIVDETQDLSTNEIRAISNQVSKSSSLTFVVDSAQKIYTKGFNWAEAGVIINDSVRLEYNFRNTKQIAKFVTPIVDGIPIDEDATMPDFSRCTREGNKPKIIKGRYSRQTSYVIDFIKNNVDLRSESVVFLHPLGGGWFDYLRTQLTASDLEFVELSRRVNWPSDDCNIGLSTMHSAKGLEFDYVFITGLNAEVFSNFDDQDDDRFMNQRRLLAMGISRAREMVIIGYKADDVSNLINYFDKRTYVELEL